MPSEENQEFGNPSRYDYMTVASPSCHDTSTTRAWWEEDAERRERFFYLVAGRLKNCITAFILAFDKTSLLADFTSCTVSLR